MATATATMATAPSATTHPYTCNTCQVAFKGSDLQRGHMQSDWHRYNLKRRVAELPPLSSDIFTEKVLATQATAAATAARAAFEKHCSVCGRTYFSHNTYDSHLQGQKHKSRLMALAAEARTDVETDSMVGSTMSIADSETPASLQTDDVVTDASRRCLFCNVVAQDIEQNVSHMSKDHGLFIPEQSFLVDLPGLLDYLHTRVHGMHECLYCGTVKRTVAGIQLHMRDKGHCMIAFESEEEVIEVGEFYDFRASYSDDEEDEEISATGDVKLGDAKVTYEVEGDEDDADDGDWEEVASDDERLARKGAYVDDGELRLPSGRIAGPRNLARYYRQNLRNYPSAAERQHQRLELAASASAAAPTARDTSGALVPRGRPGSSQLAIVTRGQGGQGLLSADASLRKQANEAERRQEEKSKRQLLRVKAAVEKRANKQKHFRDPLLQ